MVSYTIIYFTLNFVLWVIRDNAMQQFNNTNNLTHKGTHIDITN